MNWPGWDTGMWVRDFISLLPFGWCGLLTCYQLAAREVKVKLQLEATQQSVLRHLGPPTLTAPRYATSLQREGETHLHKSYFLVR